MGTAPGAAQESQRTGSPEANHNAWKCYLRRREVFVGKLSRGILSLGSHCPVFLGWRFRLDRVLGLGHVIVAFKYNTIIPEICPHKC